MKEADLISDVTFAFQPIVDIESRSVFAYEALARSKSRRPTQALFESLSDDVLHRFDRDVRVSAICLAASLGLSTKLSLNLLPQALTTLPDAVSSAIEAAKACGLDVGRLILEVTEGELIHDHRSFAASINSSRSHGLKLAIDDFGAGYSGLNLLAEFQPDIVKLDMNLVRGIDSRGPRQAIVRAVLQACMDLGLEVIAEGIETPQEFAWLRRSGVVLFQGYLFGRPTLETLAQPVLYG